MADRKISPLQKEEMLQRYAQGECAKDLAAEYGISRARLYQICNEDGNEFAFDNRTIQHLESIVYPNLREWIVDHRYTINHFAKTITRSKRVNYLWLYGKSNPSFSTITAVLKLTGLTFEKAFYKENKNA